MRRASALVTVVFAVVMIGIWVGIVAAVVISAAPPAVAAAQQAPSLPNPALLQNIPAPQPTLVRPRVLAAYGALLAAATLGVLYLYRGRAFIVYWIGAFLLLAAAMALVARGYADPRLGRVLVGLALLLVAWSGGLMLLAARSFPESALRWTTPLRLGALSATWFLAAPFVVPTDAIVATGAVVTAGLVGWASVLYLRLGRARRYAGAFLVGAGLAVVGVSTLIGLAVLLRVVPDSGALNQLAVVNVVTSIFVALGMHLLVFEDMTTELRRTNHDLELASEEVKRLAITDPLTGCHNRRFFDEIERREMQRHRRYDAPLSVVFVDVNRFKQLNDTLGHDAGDEVLRAIGALLRRQIRESDYVLRWGGDEFLLLLTCGVAEAGAKAAELKAAFVRERLGQALPPYLGLSIGVAGVSKQADNLSEAIRLADAEMYRDKVSTAGT